MIKACDIPRADGTHSITREAIVSKSREENEVAGMKGDIAKILAAATKQ